MQTFNRAFQSSLPILFSFIPLGFGFGYYGLQLGLPAYIVVLMSAVIYAGSSEFLVATLLVSLIPVPDILMATALVNFRHVFYGISVYHHYPKNILKRLYMIHALTDETYSILAAKSDVDYQFSFWLSVLNHLYWVVGVGLGATVGYFFSFKIKGLEFCLTALFIVLAIEKAITVKKYFPFIFAIIAAAIAKYFFPSQALVASMGLVCAMLFVTHKWRERKWITT